MVLIGDPYVKVEDEGDVTVSVLSLYYIKITLETLETGNILLLQFILTLFKSIKANTLPHTQSFDLKTGKSIIKI